MTFLVDFRVDLSSLNDLDYDWKEERGGGGGTAGRWDERASTGPAGRWEERAGTGAAGRWEELRTVGAARWEAETNRYTQVQYM